MRLSGCAGTVRPAQGFPPIVDLAATGQPPQVFDRDLSDCNAFAIQVDNGKAAANGAIAGAIIGTIVGAAFGLRGSELAAVAAGGAVGGAVQNAQYAQYANMTQYQIVQGCLAGRGYSVIG
jgi:uncharacterized protein YcfJ